jgi:energy-converting hydrogenase Eha subunit F
MIIMKIRTKYKIYSENLKKIIAYLTPKGMWVPYMDFRDFG